MMQVALPLRLHNLVDAVVLEALVVEKMFYGEKTADPDRGITT